MTGAFWRRFLVPGALWLVAFFAIPFGITIAISLGQATELGGVLYGFNPGNYADALDPLFAPVLLRSVGYAAATAVICLLVGYPVAYCIARHGGRCKHAVLLAHKLLEIGVLPAPATAKRNVVWGEREETGFRNVATF